MAQAIVNGEKNSIEKHYRTLRAAKQRRTGAAGCNNVGRHFEAKQNVVQVRPQKAQTAALDNNINNLYLPNKWQISVKEKQRNKLN